MKKKNGFTFVEILAVITIIGILTLISLPTIEKILKNNKEKLYEKQLDNIVLSLKSWASDNREYLPEDTGGVLTITLGNLKSEGYIEHETKNPITNKCFDNSMNLIITKIEKNYDYEIDLDTIKETDNCGVETNSPTIILNGNSVEYIEVNSIYVDKGASAKNSLGVDITDNIVKTISGSGNAIDTSKIGNEYIVSYSIEDNGIVVKISRTIKIVDTEAPVIKFSDNVVLNVEDTNFDIMRSISVTDNSGENIEITSDNNILYGVAGKYTITYRAIDSSGNKTVETRVVYINEFVNGILSSNSRCILNSGSVCSNGTEISVQVNSNVAYSFYVISDTGTELTLIMDRNIGSYIAWYNDGDNNTNNETNNLGTVSALSYLNNQTSHWTNISAIKNYTYDNNLKGTTYTYGYQKFNITNGVGNLTNKAGGVVTNIPGMTRARLLTYDEANNLKNKNSGLLPEYLYTNLVEKQTKEKHKGYWLLTANPAGSASGRYIDYAGNVSDGYVYYYDIRGVRPVITVLK